MLPFMVIEDCSSIFRSWLGAAVVRVGFHGGSRYAYNRAESVAEIS